MLKNYFKTALRNLGKNKIFSFINVFGLAVGLACCMLIAVFVYDELSYDKYPKDSANMYRVYLGVLGNGDEAVYPQVDVAVGPGIKAAFPEVADATRLSTRGEAFVQYEDKQFKEPKLAYADENFLKMFSIPYIAGDAQNGLRDPNSIVISKAMATKYFGNQQPIGKLLKLGKDEIYKVTGVIEGVPSNSHFHYDGFMSMSTMHFAHPTWSNINFYTYLQLKPGTDPKQLQAKFPQLVSKYVVPEIQHDMGLSLAEAQKSANTFRFTLTPITDIHLHSDTKYEMEANGDINYVYIFGALAIFILLLACVNFTNLSTASSAKRAREVGIRKVMGSVKGQLISQFLTESILLTFFATILAYGLAALLLPYFNTLAGKAISFRFFLQPVTITVALLLALLVGVLAGIYPAFFLSSFNTIKVLKGGNSATGGRKSLLRSGLVVFQFFVSTALIIATIVVYRQLQFMQDKKLGYDKEQVMYLPDAGLLGANQVPFEQKLLQDNRVLKASIGRDLPGSGNANGTEVYPRDEAGGKSGKEIHMNIFRVDYDYIPVMGMTMVQGRNLSKDYPTDSFAVVINEAAVRDLGWSGTDPIGKTIVRSGQQQFKVVGVVADFHYASVKQRIAPLMMLLGNNYGGMIVKIKTTNVEGFLADAKKQWAAFNPAGPFSYYFLDEKFASLYAAEKKTGQIFTAFAIIAVVIASLGLFGLAAFITEQRTREIGIRKVLGASVQEMLVLVSKDFLYLVGIACLIAIPATWWCMHKWLQDFAYRTDIAWWIFIVAAAVAIAVALFTISFQAVKAALKNPVTSLRSE